MEVALLVSAVALGFRHGFDWDHLAAITEIAGAHDRRRRALWTATVYGLGHGAVVLVLGGVLVLVGAEVPAAIDDVMGRLVGLTLVGLAVWAVLGWCAGRRPRSAGFLVVDGLRRLRARRQRVVIEHDHPHDDRHGHTHPLRSLKPSGLADEGGLSVEATREHSRCFGEERAETNLDARSPRPLRADSLSSSRATGPGTRQRTGTAHAHPHVHVGELPVSAPGPMVGLAVGAIHGVGAETPTQLLLFAGATASATTGDALAVLVAFVAGLFVSNVLVAGLFVLGVTRPRRTRVAPLVAAVVGGAVGAALLLGATLPGPAW